MFDYATLLDRPTVDIDRVALTSFIQGKAVIVTGGGGSIGLELCRQLVKLGAGRILIVENSEPALYHALEELNATETPTKVTGCLADVRDAGRLRQVFTHYEPNMVLHAAALKHVPLLEQDWGEAVQTNVLGTLNAASAAWLSKAAHFVLISTDKAVNPVSVLGVTKRLAELVCSDFDQDTLCKDTRFVSVRFGNVLGTNGSVVPKFLKQIETGGPVTVTHKDMTRYLMTAEEACNLIFMAAQQEQLIHLGATHVLSVGKSVRIVDLARRVIEAHHKLLRPIQINFTGLRPGERLSESFCADDESWIKTDPVISLVQSTTRIPRNKIVSSVNSALIMDKKELLFQFLERAKQVKAA